MAVFVGSLHLKSISPAGKTLALFSNTNDSSFSSLRFLMGINFFKDSKVISSVNGVKEFVLFCPLKKERIKAIVIP